VRLGTIYAAHGASHGFVLVLPAVLVTLRAEFGASFTTLGTVATVSSMLYGLGALPGGLLADRFGAPVLLRVFAGLSVVCCGLAAVAPGSGGWPPPQEQAAAGAVSQGALAGVAGGVVADRSGLAAVFGFLGLVAVVNSLGGLAVRGLLGPGSTGRPPAS
jgi:hypothetical protein